MATADGGWGWVVVLATFVMNILLDGTKYSFGIMFIDLLDTFKKSKSDISWILSLQIGFSQLPGPIIGALVNRYGCRAVATVGALTSFLGFLLSFFATSLVHLYITFGCIAGIGFGMCILPFVVTLPRYFDRRLTIAVGIGATGSGVGMIVLNPVTKILLDEYAWRGTILLEAGRLLNGVVCACVLRPVLAPSNKPEEIKTSTNLDELADDDLEVKSPMLIRESSGDGTNITTSGSEGRLKLHVDDETNTSSRVVMEMAGCQGKAQLSYLTEKSSCTEAPSASGLISTPGDIGEARKKKRWLSVKPLKSLSFWMYLLSSVVFEFSLYTPFTFVPDMMVELGHQKQDAVWVMFVLGIASTIGRVAIGPVADHLCADRIRVCYIITILCAVAIGVAPFCSSLESFMAFGVLFGFLSGSSCSVRGVVIPDLYGVQRIADFYGILMFFVGIAAIVGLPIAGMIVDLSNSYSVTMLVAAAEMAAAGILIILATVIARR